MKRSSIIAFFRRLFLRDLTPDDQAKYLGIVARVDPLWRLTGIPQKPALWKLLLLWLIVAAGLIALIACWRSA